MKLVVTTQYPSRGKSFICPIVEISSHELDKSEEEMIDVLSSLDENVHGCIDHSGGDGVCNVDLPDACEDREEAMQKGMALFLDAMNLLDESNES